MAGAPRTARRLIACHTSSTVRQWSSMISDGRCVWSRRMRWPSISPCQRSVAMGCVMALRRLGGSLALPSLRDEAVAEGEVECLGHWLVGDLAFVNVNRAGNGPVFLGRLFHAELRDGD